MGHSLTNLDLTDPLMRSPVLFTIAALLVLDDKLHHKCLLKESATLNLLLHCEFNFYSSAMGLSVDELGVQKFDIFQSFDIFQAKCKELRRFQLVLSPWGSKVAIALSTVLQCGVSSDPLRNVYLGFKTAYTSIGGVWIGHYTADAAADMLGEQKFRVANSYASVALATDNCFVCD
jgi:hypothetical protein